MDLQNWVIDLFNRLEPSHQVLTVLALIACVVFLTIRRYFHRIRLKEAELRFRESELERERAKVRYEEAQVRVRDSVVENRELLFQVAEQDFNLKQLRGDLEQRESEIATLESERNALQDTFVKLQSVDSDVWLEAHDENVFPPRFCPFEDRTGTTKFVAVQNLKGGVGKTTLVGNLGAAFATGITGKPMRVLIVDLDFQGNLSNSCVEDDDLRYRRTQASPLTSAKLIDESCAGNPEQLFNQLMASVPGTHERCKAVIASELLEKADFRQQARFLVSRFEVRYLHRALFHDKYVFNHFDLVLFDCPPRLTTSAINALFASDYVLVPTTLHPNDVDAVPRTLNWLKKLRSLPSYPLQQVGVVINKTYRKGTIHDTTKTEQRQLERLQHSLRPYAFAADAIFEDTVPTSALIARYAEGSTPLGTSQEGHEIYDGIAQELNARLAKLEFAEELL